MNAIFLFDDLHPGPDGMNILSPMADLRSSFDIRVGALTVLQRTRRWIGEQVLGILPRPDLEQLCIDMHPGVPTRLPADDKPVLLVNGRCLLRLPEIQSLSMGQAVIERETQAIVAACGTPSQLRTALAGDLGRFHLSIREDVVLISHPWQVRRFIGPVMNSDMDLLAGDRELVLQRTVQSGCTMFGPHSLRAHPTARFYPGVVLDLEHGDIVIDAAATVRPGAIIVGPVYIGPNSVVLDGALIKGPTAAGAYCKLAGEVSSTIVQGFSNKAHDGNLGESWLGEWVNLGAGTTTSSLLNTYGKIAVMTRPDGVREQSGEQFLGSTIGDHFKSAICTRLMTGAVVHTGTMYAASSPISGCIGPFRWCTDAGITTYRYDKFEAAACAAMSRRAIPLCGAYRQWMAAWYRQCFRPIGPSI